MRKLGIVLLCTLALTCVGQVLGEETLPPVRVGTGQTVWQVTNGQTLVVTSDPTVSADIHLSVVTATQVTGTAVRTSSGTSEGDVTILWVNWNLSVHLHLSALAPQVPFGMEGGEGDKRTTSGAKQRSEP